MNHTQDDLKAIQEIRNIMDRSTRYRSLSGLSGIFAGLSALLGAGLVKWYFSKHDHRVNGQVNLYYQEHLGFLLGVAAMVLVLAAITATWFTIRNARRNKQAVWDKPSQRLLANLAIPLATGAGFCAILIYHDILYLIAPSMLVFYGLSLLNAGKYTFADIRYLGIFQIFLGIVACIFPQYGLLLWTVGFGFLHILFGAVVYYKYERS